LEKSPAGRRRHKTARAMLAASSRTAGIQTFSENCGLFFGGLGDGGGRCFRAPPAKEKSQMPGAALAAAERAQEQEEQYGPFQDAAAVRAQNIFTSAKRALTRAHPK